MNAKILLNSLGWFVSNHEDFSCVGVVRRTFSVQWSSVDTNTLVTPCMVRRRRRCYAVQSVGSLLFTFLRPELLFVSPSHLGSVG